MKIRAATSALVLIALLSTLAQAGDRQPLPTHRPHLAIGMCAHRGVKAKAPENTIPAVLKAIELGYQYVEIDVRYAKDGAPIMMHDSSTLRTTGFPGKVSAMTLDQLKRLDAGWWKGPQFMGARVPTVEEVLKIMRGKIKLYLDQKEPPRPELIRLLKEYGFLPDNMVVVGSGGPVRKFLELEPGAPVMPKLRPGDQVEDLLEEFPSAYAVNTDCAELTALMVDDAHRHGLRVFTNILALSKLDERRCMRRTIELGADVAQFDNVDLFLKVREEMEREAAGNDGED